MDPDLPDEEEQRDGILKVKNRQDLDEELHNIKRIKERLFADGELHRDGIVRRNRNRLNWRGEEEDYDNMISFNSDEETSDEDTGIVAQVKINYVEDIEGNAVADDGGGGDGEEDEFESMEATKFEGAFGGPAGSILSYVIRDKATYEKLTESKEVSSSRLSRMRMKRKRFTRKGPIVKTVSDFEKRKLFARL